MGQTPPKQRTVIQKLMARRSVLSVLLEAAACVPLILLACVARCCPKPIDVGIGPEPLINNVYHQKALQRLGYRVESFVMGTYFITDAFDVNLAKKRCDVLPAVWRPLWLFVRAMFHYKALFLYFNGGPLFYTNILGPLEPFLLKLAGVKVVVMPYGSDVQDMRRSKNLYFRHVTMLDYPQQFRQFPTVARNIDRWTRHADWVISGVEWVDYMPHWHTLMLGHFSIDTESVKPSADSRRPEADGDRPFRILHAPNHKAIKGTQALLNAIDQLQAEGLNLELVLLQGVPNHQIHQAIESVDLVADQFVVGWYAMFAIEAMALEKPVLCYLREDLLTFYQQAGLLAAEEMPLINTPILELADRIRWAYHHREALTAHGRRGRTFVEAHHSLASVGAVFDSILASVGVLPSQPRASEIGVAPTRVAAEAPVPTA